MSRPIVWALAVAAMAGTWAMSTADRLANSFGAETEAARPGDGPTILKVAADLRGHFIVHPMIDGRRLRMLVDTGASTVALSYEDAVAAGIRPSPSAFREPVSTAGGRVLAARARIGEIRLGDIVVRNVDAMVLPAGKMSGSLLGMSFLRRIGGFEISRGQLTLRG
jgi:aspartyl protease family protein